MPDWCHNTLIVTNGDPKIVFESVRTQNSLFDFNTLIPMPADIGDRMVVNKHGFTRPEWYVWSCEHWGTKWNACYAQHSSKNPHNTIQFDTAWGPPVPVFEALAKKFPEHEFTIDAADTTHFHATFNIKDGGIVCYDETEEDIPITAQAAAELRAVFGIEEAND